MDMVVLGCSGSVGGPDSPASGYVVKDSAGTQLLLDCGPGVLAAMQAEADVNPSECHVVFSHMHADHCLDFPSLLVWRRFHPTAPASRTHTMLGPAIAYEHLSHAGGDFPDQPDAFVDSFEIRHHSPGVGRFSAQTYPGTRIGDLYVYSTPAVHPTESYIVRVEDSQGRSLVYSGDTGWTDNLVDIAADADVLLCEATWGECSGGKPEGMHLCGGDAGRVARLAGVSTLILTHIPPWGDAEATLRSAQKEFEGEILVAAQGMRQSI